jgi:hypothetical protein
MAWTEIPDFTTGQVLTAGRMNQMRNNENIGHRVCTSTTRPSSPDTGTMIYETDTGRVMFWNGASWGGEYQNTPAGSVLTFHGERTSAPAVGNNWPLGNGGITGNLAVPYAGRLIAGSFMSDSSTNGTVTAQVVKNGTTQGTGYQFSVTGASQTVNNIFATPLALAAGDRFNLQCTAVTATISQTTFTLIMVLN